MQCQHCLPLNKHAGFSESEFLSSSHLTSFSNPLRVALNIDIGLNELGKSCLALSGFARNIIFDEYNILIRRFLACFPGF